MRSKRAEGMVRVWHVEHDTNYVLHLNDPRHMAQPKDVVRSLAFNARRRMLVGATAQGRVCFWHFIGSRTVGGSGSGINGGSGSGFAAEGASATIEPSESDWDVLPPVSMGGHGIDALEWGPAGDSGLLCVRMLQAVSGAHDGPSDQLWPPRTNNEWRNISSPKFHACIFFAACCKRNLFWSCVGDIVTVASDDMVPTTDYFTPDCVVMRETRCLIHLFS